MYHGTFFHDNLLEYKITQPENSNWHKIWLHIYSKKNMHIFHMKLLRVCIYFKVSLGDYHSNVVSHTSGNESQWQYVNKHSYNN